MKKLENYDLINEAGELKKLPAGIYPVQIKEVTDVPEKEYLEVKFDICGGEFKGYFSNLENAGKTIRSYKEGALPFFKAFITAIEKTNSGYQWNWDEKTLNGKYVMGIFGEEEYINKDGKVAVGTKLVEFRSKEAFVNGKCKVPELKKLPADQVPVTPEVVKTEVIDDDLPF